MTAAPVASNPTESFTSISAAARAPFTPGMRVPVTLETAVAVYPGASHPVWARSEDGAAWRGVATLEERSGRITLKFDRVMVGANQFTLNAYAEGQDGPGVGGRVKSVAPNAAQAAMQALLGGVQSFAQSQAASSTTITNTGLVVQQQRPQNFWLALGGALAGAFTIPDSKVSVTPLGQLSVGEKLNVRVDVTDAAAQQ